MRSLRKRTPAERVTSCNVQRNWRWALVLVAAGVVLLRYGIFGAASDEERIRKRLGELAAAAHWERADGDMLRRAAHLKEVVSEAFLPDAVVDVPDAPTSKLDREALVLFASDVRALESLTLDFKDTDVRLSQDEQSAAVRSDAILTTEHDGQLDRDKRRVLMTWKKRDDKWRIADVTVPEPPNDQPEARP